jgi:hypothetical protein
MTFKSFLIIIFFFSIVSCRSISCKNNEAVINSDCDYYLNHSSIPLGKLTKGLIVVILNSYYAVERDDGNFNIYVEVETRDNTVKGYINEFYLTYHDNNNYNFWFKNILLTRYYYYMESIEEIYKSEYMQLLNEGVEKIDSILMMKHFFSENRILISEKYLVIGNSENSTIYKIVSIKRNGSTYLLNLFDYNKKEFDLVMVTDGNSVIITNFISKNEIFFQNVIERSLNIKYIIYDREKSNILKDDIIFWVQNNSEISIK